MKLVAVLVMGAIVWGAAGCVRHLGYPGRVETVEAPAPELRRYRLLRVQITHADDELSNRRRNQLGAAIARTLERRTHFSKVLPYARSRGYADRAPVLELVLHRYEVPAFESGTEIGLEGEGRIVAPDETVIGRFEIEASKDSSWGKLFGLRVVDDAPGDGFKLIARRTAEHVADYIESTPRPE